MLDYHYQTQCPAPVRSEIGRQLNVSRSGVNEMKLENWIGRHVHAYNYLGGVTHMLVPDNLKTGIMKKPL